MNWKDTYREYIKHTLGEEDGLLEEQAETIEYAKKFWPDIEETLNTLSRDDMWMVDGFCALLRKRSKKPTNEEGEFILGIIEELFEIYELTYTNLPKAKRRLNRLLWDLAQEYVCPDCEERVNIHR